MNIHGKPLSKYIDHTLLKADAQEPAIEKLCQEAIRYDFASVCVNSSWVPTAARILADSDVKVCTVIGFPLGACSTEAKVCEAGQAILAGASEIDMVLHIGHLKAGDIDYVQEDIRQVAEVCHQHAGTILKVIIETCLLTDQEKVTACKAAEAAGADFVKTSTGFAAAGATAADVRLMKEAVGTRLQVKAAGGIRDLETALAMIEAGADRIGASAGIQIIEAAK